MNVIPLHVVRVICRRAMIAGMRKRANIEKRAVKVM